ncbi:MAG: hypothetical protein JF586_22965 [Burkholderiales bacterium]|nr:hypothetical protein [Burkholderiales bacterium]
MANARPSARPLPPAAALGRRARVVAVSLAGAFAGLAVGAAGGMGGSPADRGAASVSTPTSTPGAAGVRQAGLVSAGVAMVLAPASEAVVEREGRQDGEGGPP